MLLINNEIDLGKSFERLKMELDHTTSLVTPPTTNESYAYALGRLQSAVRVHLTRCTNPTSDEERDDLKGINI